MVRGVAAHAFCGGTKWTGARKRTSLSCPGVAEIQVGKVLGEEM